MRIDRMIKTPYEMTDQEVAFKRAFTETVTKVCLT